MKKIAILILAMATLSMFFASVSIANVPAPPVNQIIGFDDTQFSALTEADCRACHTSGLPDRHHMLYGTDMTPGKCAATIGACELSGNDGAACVTVADCDNSTGTAVCNNPEVECYADVECETGGIDICSNNTKFCPVGDECSGRGVICTDAPYCLGNAASTANPNDGVYGCLTCHPEDTSGGVTNFVVVRDCQVCHAATPGTPNVHHLDQIDVSVDPISGVAENVENTNCADCHGDLVDNGNDGHIVPTYEPSLVTPMPHNSDEVTGDQLPGGCAFCHDAGTDTVSGIEVIDNHDTHHDTGVYRDRYGSSMSPLWDGNKDGVVDPAGERICGLCHLNNDYHPVPGTDNKLRGIRQCELCHGMESLHSIQVDSDDSGDITVGGELYGYGHVGKDDPGADSDCWGCHGFAMASAAAPGSEVITPSIDAVSPVVIAANVDTVITVTGNSFINDGISAIIELNGVAVTPSIVANDTITATVNVPAGLYSVVADKNGTESNPVILIANDLGITITDIETSCGDCAGTATITGTGFGDISGIPASALEFINVKQGDVVLTIESWTDTQIEVSGVVCDGTPITVNALMGSATK